MNRHYIAWRLRTFRPFKPVPPPDVHEFDHLDPTLPPHVPGAVMPSIPPDHPSRRGRRTAF